jgi:hypothetical protein
MPPAREARVGTEAIVPARSNVDRARGGVATDESAALGDASRATRAGSSAGGAAAAAAGAALGGSGVGTTGAGSGAEAGTGAGAGAGCAAAGGGAGTAGELGAGGAAGGAGGGLGAPRDGSNWSGSTYVSPSPTRIPRWRYGVWCSASPDGPESAIGSPSAREAPFRTRSVPRCVSEAL